MRSTFGDCTLVSVSEPATGSLSAGPAPHRAASDSRVSRRRGRLLVVHAGKVEAGDDAGSGRRRDDHASGTQAPLFHDAQGSRQVVPQRVAVNDGIIGPKSQP